VAKSASRIKKYKFCGAESQAKRIIKFSKIDGNRKIFAFGFDKLMSAHFKGRSEKSKFLQFSRKFIQLRQVG